MKIAGLSLCVLLACHPREQTRPPPDAGAHPLARVCAQAACSRRAEVEILRDAQGHIARYVVQGSIAECSHPPTSVFDASGTLLGSMGSNPVVRGSPEQRAAQTKWEELTAGLQKAEAEQCP